MRDGGFRHAINRFSWQGDKSRLRTEINNATMLLLNHHPTCSLAREECALQIDGQGQIEILFTHILGKIAWTQPCIIHQDIQLSKMSYSRIDCLLNLVELSDIH